MGFCWSSPSPSTPSPWSSPANCWTWIADSWRARRCRLGLHDDVLMMTSSRVYLKCIACDRETNGIAFPEPAERKDRAV